MKFLLTLLLSMNCFAADIKISQLPLGSGAAIAVNDSFPYVQSSNLITKRLTIYDLVNVPLFVSTYATKANPTFTGVVTAPSFVGPLTGNASTATALAANPADCGSDTFANAIAANGNLTCAAITNASTSGTSSNDPSTLVLRNASGNFAAGTITATLTGNSSTATALAANPADCSANNFATTIAANGDLTCAQVSLTAGVTGVLPIANGGTNNGSLSVLAGGIAYVDGTKLATTTSGSTGSYLKANGASAPTWQSFTAPTVQSFTSGSGTYTTPAGVKYIIVRMVGPGGGGAGAGSGSPGCGGNGSAATTFGSSFLTANAGAGTCPLSVPGAGGSVTVNSPALDFGSFQGSTSTSSNNTGFTAGAPGGGTPFSSGGPGGGGGFSSGSAPVANTGAGGGGGGCSTASPGAGGGSGGYIHAMVPSPSATYAYSVGAGGAGGTAGSGGGAGGAGAAGVIIVTEYYQ